MRERRVRVSASRAEGTSPPQALPSPRRLFLSHATETQKGRQQDSYRFSESTHARCFTAIAVARAALSATARRLGAGFATCRRQAAWEPEGHRFEEAGCFRVVTPAAQARRAYELWFRAILAKKSVCARSREAPIPARMDHRD